MEIDDKTIDLAVQFWDETEEIIKKAEHVNNAMIVPAVSELRYAGRKLIDYFHAVRAKQTKKVINGHLEDFTQCCIRARHDAIDATVTYISIYLKNLEDEVGIEIVNEEFPRHEQFKRTLLEANQRIVLTRRERYKRNELYSEINDKSINDIIKDYNDLNFSKRILFKKRKALDFQRKAAIWSLIFGAIGVIGVIITIISLAV